MSSKPTRILTIQHDSGREWVDIDSFGTIWWRAREGVADRMTEAGFPIDLRFLAEKFEEAGRAFDASRLPDGTIVDPYAVNCGRELQRIQDGAAPA